MGEKLTYEELEQKVHDLELAEIRREKAEEALKDGNRQFSTLLNNLPGISYRCLNDDSWTMLYISDGCAALSGYPCSELIGNNAISFNELINPADRGFVRQEVRKGLQNNSAFTVEYRIRDRHGKEKWVWEKGVAVGRDVNGVTVIEGFISDISARKRIEEALQAAHKRFMTVLNSIDATIHVIDPETHEIMFMNEKMIKTFGRDLTGETCWKAFKNLSAPCPFCNIDKLFDENGHPVDVLVWQEKHTRTGRTNLCHDRIIEWTNGRPVKLQIATDVTELKRMEEDLRQAHKMEAIGTLAGGIAHEFNNILGIILGNAELSLDEIPSWNPSREFIEEVRTACLRGKDVVKQLLSFSRRSNHQKIPLDLAKTVRDSLGLMRASLPSTIRFEEAIPARGPAVMADPTQMNQILINLCNNAYHAMETEGGKLKISLKPVIVKRRKSFLDQKLGPGKYIRLTVSDNGSGMPAKVLERVFDPFYTTKEVNKGTGLGLAVVHGIVKNHDGFIEIASKPGKGTSVHCYFPAIPEAPIPEPVKGSIPAGGSETIMFIDDEESLVNLARRHLERLGYQVEVSTDPLKAISRIQAEPERFDLVITDMTMPDMTGDKLIQEITRIRPGIRTIITTGYSEKLEPDNSSRIGASGFLPKPIDRNALADMIRRLLDDRDSREPGA